MKNMKCSKCNVKLIKINTVLRFAGIDVTNVPCLKCPKCGGEIFKDNVVERVGQLLNQAGLVSNVGFKRNLSESGRGELTLRIPKEISRQLALTGKDKVTIHGQGTGFLVKVVGRIPPSQGYEDETREQIVY